jgi:hypothetical protein
MIITRGGVVVITDGIMVTGVYDAFMTPPKLTSGEEEWLKKFVPSEAKAEVKVVDPVLEQFVQDCLNSDAQR